MLYRRSVSLNKTCTHKCIYNISPARSKYSLTRLALINFVWSVFNSVDQQSLIKHFVNQFINSFNSVGLQYIYKLFKSVLYNNYKFYKQTQRDKMQKDVFIIKKRLYWTLYTTKRRFWDYQFLCKMLYLSVKRSQLYSVDKF